MPTFMPVALAAVLWTCACGDGGTEPTPPPDPPRPTTLTVTPASAQLTALGATVQLTAEVRDQSGSVMARVAVTWSSSSPSVAAVDASGLVTAEANGTAIITGAAGSARGMAQITVEDPDRAALVSLYEATDGPNWTNNDGWLTDAPLEDWYGISVDDQGRVEQIALPSNGLGGPIPDELANVVTLQVLSLGHNELAGPIPPEIGNLAQLTTLLLHENQLTGPIPRELGNLASLQWLYLGGNELTGPTPPELGNLANLLDLRLHQNKLTGTIPPELGNLANLRDLTLYENQFTGSIPPQLGNLAGLLRLKIDHNDLTGEVPPELGRMSSLHALTLARNARMEGALPTELTALQRLDVLMAGGTELCAPSDPAFLAWLEGIGRRWIPSCEDGPIAYLTQAVQSRSSPVGLVAGEKALLRVFLAATQNTSAGIPVVRARFYRDGRETHVENISGKSTPIPTELDEGDLAKSANAEIPGDVIEPGLEMVIEVDPDGTLDSSLGSRNVSPSRGAWP